MDEVQAVKFWNEMALGEVIGYTPDSEVCQGGPITKDNYVSSIIEHEGMKSLTVPYVSCFQYGPSTMINPQKDEAKKVVEFLRNIADKIESSITVDLRTEEQKKENTPGEPPLPHNCRY